MKAFFVQIKCELGKAYEVAAALAEVVSHDYRPANLECCDRAEPDTKALAPACPA